MGKRKKSNLYKNNYRFIDSSVLNDSTYLDYLERLTKIALSIFEWVNLPESMNPFFLEKSLFYKGMASILYDNDLGFLNTNCSSAGTLNIYGLPTDLSCYSFEYQTFRKLYTGLNSSSQNDNKECILVMNNYERIPTTGTLELFAYRLYQAERSSDTNINAQRTPVLITVDESQRLFMENLYSQYEGNKPIIFGDKNQVNENVIRSINTQAPFVADKLQDYKKEIWNEALTFLGINNIMIDKKERLVSDEANSNNELINLNLQSYLAPRKYACKQFNKKFGFEGTDKEISVRVRSDLHNIIKNNESIINDFNLEGENFG